MNIEDFSSHFYQVGEENLIEGFYTNKDVSKLISEDVENMDKNFQEVLKEFCFRASYFREKSLELEKLEFSTDTLLKNNIWNSSEILKSKVFRIYECVFELKKAYKSYEFSGTRFDNYSLELNEQNEFYFSCYIPAYHGYLNSLESLKSYINTVISEKRRILNSQLFSLLIDEDKISISSKTRDILKMKSLITTLIYEYQKNYINPVFITEVKPFIFNLLMLLSGNKDNNTLEFIIRQFMIFPGGNLLSEIYDQVIVFPEYQELSESLVFHENDFVRILNLLSLISNSATSSCLDYDPQDWEIVNIETNGNCSVMNSQTSFLLKEQEICCLLSKLQLTTWIDRLITFNKSDKPQEYSEFMFKLRLMNALLILLLKLSNMYPLDIYENLSFCLGTKCNEVLLKMNNYILNDPYFSKQQDCNNHQHEVQEVLSLKDIIIVGFIIEFTKGLSHDIWNLLTFEYLRDVPDTFLSILVDHLEFLSKNEENKLKKPGYLESVVDLLSNCAQFMNSNSFLIEKRLFKVIFELLICQDERNKFKSFPYLNFV